VLPTVTGISESKRWFWKSVSCNCLWFIAKNESGCKISNLVPVNLSGKKTPGGHVGGNFKGAALDKRRELSLKITDLNQMRLQEVEC
jgi:hypothetical protein